MNVFFKEVEKIYKDLRASRPDYNKDEYKWRLGVAFINKIEHEFDLFRYVDCTGVKHTLFGIEVEIDYLNPWIVQIFEDITDKIAVCKKEENTKRKELIEYLTMLKKQARYNDSDTLIEDVRLSSFFYVINKAIKFLEAESEEKNETTK